MVKRIIFCAFFNILFANGLANAQKGPIGSEAGLRFGVRPALTYRFMLKEGQLAELIFAKSGQSLLFTALYQKQEPLTIHGFYGRYGGGFSLGGWNERLISGLDMQVGVDYYIPVAPIVLSLDVRPWMRITGDFSVNGELALSLRYVF